MGHCGLSRQYFWSKEEIASWLLSTALNASHAARGLAQSAHSGLFVELKEQPSLSRQVTRKGLQANKLCWAGGFCDRALTYKALPVPGLVVGLGRWDGAAEEAQSY